MFFKIFLTEQRTAVDEITYITLKARSYYAGISLESRLNFTQLSARFEDVSPQAERLNIRNWKIKHVVSALRHGGGSILTY